MKPNICTQCLDDIGETIEEYPDLCDNLAELAQQWAADTTGEAFELLEVLPKYTWLYPKCHPERGWLYHLVLLDEEGCVHDAWHPKAVLPVENYLRVVFPNQEPTWQTVQARHRQARVMLDPSPGRKSLLPSPTQFQPCGSPAH